MLGLVAMATTVDNLYASMKALVCIVGNNQLALKEMERTGGFQVECCFSIGFNYDYPDDACISTTVFSYSLAMQYHAIILHGYVVS